jgi:hypothetical protein
MERDMSYGVMPALPRWPGLLEPATPGGRLLAATAAYDAAKAREAARFTRNFRPPQHPVIRYAPDVAAKLHPSAPRYPWMPDHIRVYVDPTLPRGWMRACHADGTTALWVTL